MPSERMKSQIFIQPRVASIDQHRKDARQKDFRSTIHIARRNDLRQKNSMHAAALAAKLLPSYVAQPG